MEQVELERRLAQSPLLAGVSLPAEQARVQSFPAGHILSDRPGGVSSVGLILRSEGNLLTVLDTPALEKLLYHPSRTK